ncbi:MAG: PhzF family phenazine biosynthesis protein [Candidatus Zixiibacteriota bacterium]|nr:MAG: PhzF family phenazine biosynthesis protein [candidate division Zixibacteria bacterium]
MKLPLYQVDAFTDRLFGGNPAAVVPLDQWLPDATLQAVAAENNLSETAFFVPLAASGDPGRPGPHGVLGADFHLRWFTPQVEVDLCGHATLATGHVLFRHRGYAGRVIRFASRSGELRVTREDDWLTLDFPADPPGESLTAGLEPLRAALNLPPQEVRQTRDNWFAVYETAEPVEALAPDFARLKQVAPHGLIVTAPGRDVDFVSRFFAPALGIDEDPVTGSAHTSLVPYWAGRLGQTELTARQVSARGGYLKCRHRGSRLDLSGQAVTYLEGEISL